MCAIYYSSFLARRTEVEGDISFLLRCVHFILNSCGLVLLLLGAREKVEEGTGADGCCSQVLGGL